MIIVANNEWGISTSASTQHGEKNIADRGKAFGIKTAVINGNDVVASDEAIRAAMDYVRQQRKPFLLEAKVSRLYGHSSASGAMPHTHEADPLTLFEQQLITAGQITTETAKATRERYEQEFRQMAEQVKTEPQPDPASIYDYTYWQQKGKTW